MVVQVAEKDVAVAADLGNRLDAEFEEAGLNALVTIRGLRDQSVSPSRVMSKSTSVHDESVDRLVQLVAARSRTSDSQPSLAYIPNASANMAFVTAPRHHLVFGRRGAGKTALLLEARKLTDGDKHLSVWENLQTLRHESIHRVFLHISARILVALQTHFQWRTRTPGIAASIDDMAHRVQALLRPPETDELAVRRLVPELQLLLSRALAGEGHRLYIFLDDFYYVPRDSQPILLDMLHGCVRDCDAWLKVASIRHLTRWFQGSPPVGLQVGHDADAIDLDVSLQEPRRAIAFLREVLVRYADYVGIRRLSAVFSDDAIERLVLASGAVPRDFLVLAGGAIARARTREKARVVGVQDVNQAAGDAWKAKQQELEEDLASATGSAERTLRGLGKLRNFCLNEETYTYYRVDFRDKESAAQPYETLTNLLEVRLTHLIDPSLSGSRAGERFEVFMLDLSQFSGSRLKQNLRILDLQGGRLVAKKTRSKEPEAARVGKTAREVNAILRAAPVLPLSLFEE